MITQYPFRERLQGRHGRVRAEPASPGLVLAPALLLSLQNAQGTPGGGGSRAGPARLGQPSSHVLGEDVEAPPGRGSRGVRDLRRRPAAGLPPSWPRPRAPPPGPAPHGPAHRIGRARQSPAPRPRPAAAPAVHLPASRLHALGWGGRGLALGFEEFLGPSKGRKRCPRMEGSGEKTGDLRHVAPTPPAAPASPSSAAAAPGGGPPREGPQPALPTRSGFN